VSFVCCQVEVSATGWSLVQRSPTECGVSKKCVIVKRRKMRRPRPPRGCRAIEKKWQYMGVGVPGIVAKRVVHRCSRDRESGVHRRVH
jgi:hypothetical protein